MLLFKLLLTSLYGKLFEALSFKFLKCRYRISLLLNKESVYHIHFNQQLDQNSLHGCFIPLYLCYSKQPHLISQLHECLLYVCIWKYMQL